jgi:hypothetical protein
MNWYPEVNPTGYHAVIGTASPVRASPMAMTCPAGSARGRSTRCVSPMKCTLRGPAPRLVTRTTLPLVCALAISNA